MVELGILLFGGLFILARVIYLKPAKLKYMHRRLRKIPKWLLKAIGVLYLILCFVGSFSLRVFTYKYFGI